MTGNRDWAAVPSPADQLVPQFSTKLLSGLKKTAMHRSGYGRMFWCFEVFYIVQRILQPCRCVEFRRSTNRDEYFVGSYQSQCDHPFCFDYETFAECQFC